MRLSNDTRHLIVFGNDGSNCLPENPAVTKSNLKHCWRFQVSLPRAARPGIERRGTGLSMPFKFLEAILTGPVGRVSLVASRNSTPCAGQRYCCGSAAAMRCGSSGECGHEDQFFRAIIMRAAVLNSRNVMPCIASPKGWSEPLLEPPALPKIPKPS